MWQIIIDLKSFMGKSPMCGNYLLIIPFVADFYQGKSQFPQKFIAFYLKKIVADC